MSDENRIPLLKMLVLISDKQRFKKASEIMHHLQLHLHFQCHCEGTASSEILDWLGLGRTEKMLGICMAHEPRIKELLRQISRELQLVVPNNGIAFTLALSGVSNPLMRMLVNEEERERIRGGMEKEIERVKREAEYDLIMAIINQGFSEEVMKAARGAGATGGTVMHARGMGLEEAMKVWGISVQAEKEIVLILARKANCLEIMKAIGKQCGSATEARGLIFSLPVSSVAGLDMPSFDGNEGK